MNTKTLRLESPVYKEHEDFDGEKFGHKIWWIDTNQGTLKLADIAKAIDMTMQGLLRRLKRDGHEHPDILRDAGHGGWTDEARKRQRERKLLHLAMEWENATDIPDEDIGKYQHLSEKDRSHNLKKIKGPGIFERRRMETKDGVKRIKLTKRGNRRAWRTPRPLEQGIVRG